MWNENIIAYVVSHLLRAMMRKINVRGNLYFSSRLEGALTPPLIYLSMKHVGICKMKNLTIELYLKEIKGLKS